MKALKEKRVSLRSLFRRSLVILSLLALAFASCSDSGGGDDTGNGNNGNNGNGQTPAPVPTVKVADMTVMEHPYLPSYEGAYPDLTGLKVLIFWSDGSTPTIETDTTKFVVYPSVAYVSADSTSASPRSEKEYSTFNKYGIQYRADALINPAALKKNVYIPYVVAISDYDTVQIYGNLGTVYEDQDFEPWPLEMGAEYEAIESSPSTPPKDYQSKTLVKGDPVWPTGDALNQGKKVNRISDNIDAWRIKLNLDPDTDADADKYPKAEYLLRVENDGTIIAIEVPIETFYYVDNFELVSGADKIEGVYADDQDYNEIPNPINDSSTDADYQKAPSVQIGQRWWKKLYDANLQFKVTYYDPKAPAGSTGPTRTIGMAEYTKAMYTTDGEGNPKASVPIMTGRPQPTSIVNPSTPGTGGKLMVSDVLTSVIDPNNGNDEYDLSLRLFYYNRLITGAPGEGLVDLKELSDNSVGNPTAPDYVKPNYAVVPLTENGVIYTFDSIRSARKENTNFENDDIPARVPSNLDTNWAKKNAYEAIQTYYDVLWVYVNKDGKKMEVPGTWRPYAAPSGTPLVDPIFEDFEYDPTESSDEALTCEIKFDLPVSMQLDNEFEETLEFPFKMKP